MSLAAGFSIPVLLGVVLGVAPAVLLWLRGSNSSTPLSQEAENKEVAVASVNVAFK